MSKQDSLFELVKSLNQSEKRYFRIFASRHVKGSENQYMKIFSVLDGLDQYDEDTIRKTIEKEKFNGNVSRVKTYLKELILKSLVAYNADSSIRNRIKDILRTVEVLFQKSLGHQCQKQLEKAEKLAVENDELILMLEIIEWKGKILRLVGLPNDPQAFYEQMEEDLFKYSGMIQNLFKFSGLSLLLHLFTMSKGHGRSEEDKEKLEELLNNPLLADESMAHSFEAKIRFHSLKAYIGINRFDYDFAYDHIVSLLQLMESRPTRLQEATGIYLANMRNLILVSRMRERHDLARYWVDRLNKVSKKLLGTKIRQKNAHEYFANLLTQTDLYKDTGEIEIALEIIEQYEQDFGKLKSQLRETGMIVHHFVSGCIYFIDEQYSTAVKHFTQVINFPNISLREDLHCMTRIILLLSHYELGNVDLLEYLVKAASRYLEKKKRLYGLEAALLRFILKDFLAVRGTQMWKSALAKLRDELTEITQSPYERKALKYFDFITYLDSRIKDRPMKVLLLEKDQQILQD